MSLLTHIIKLGIFICACLAVTSGSNAHFVYREDWRERACSRVLHKVRHELVSSPLPPELNGDWVSYRCEVRSGPEYVIRHFSFHDNTFESVVYRYQDPDCHVPMYAIQSHGTHKLTQPSWTVRGASEAEYEVTSAHLVTYSRNVSVDLSLQLSGGCSADLAKQPLIPYTKYLIYSPPVRYSRTHSSTLSQQQHNTLSQQQSTLSQNQDNALSHQHNMTAQQPHSFSQHYDSSSQQLYHDPIPQLQSKPTHSQLSGIDCFGPLNFTLHELQLVMVEFRRHTHNNHIKPQASREPLDHIKPYNHREPFDLIQPSYHRQPVDHRQTHDQTEIHRRQDGSQHHSRALRYGTRELLLGAVHSKPLERQTHKPTSFQTSLKEAHTPGCGVCSRVAYSSSMTPPRLAPHPGTLLSLEGEWVSTRCESRQYGMFLTRWLHFLSDGSSWQGQYDYYHDAICHQPSFSLSAKGSYAGGTDSKLVEGAKDFSFKVTRLKVTPHDQVTVDSMNHYDGNGCGKPHAWTINVEQDVTRTGGCVTLGIRLPNMERDIMKMEIIHRKLHLYVGQRLVDKKPGTSYQSERPTAFQEPLVKCDQVSLDMSINTAPGGHGWAGSVALPLSAGPDDFSVLESSAQSHCHLHNFYMSIIVVMTVTLGGV